MGIQKELFYQFMGKDKQNLATAILYFGLIFIILFSCVFYGQIDGFINKDYNPSFVSATQVNSCDVKVYTFYVGQAESSLIQLPDNKFVLIDFGVDYNNQDFSCSVLLKNLNNLLPNKKIDYLFLTHDDKDHYGFGEQLFENFEIGVFYRPYVFVQGEVGYVESAGYVNSDYTNFINKAKQYDTQIQMITPAMSNSVIYQQNDVTIKILSPYKYSYSNSNDISTVIKLEYKNKSMLFTGDITTETEEYLCKNLKEEIKCDVLKIPHHGSSTSSSETFLKQTSAQWAIICAGKNNEYGHPSNATMEKLKDYFNNNNIIVNSNRGDVCIGITQDQILINLQNTNLFEVTYFAYWIIVLFLLVVITYVVIIKNIINCNKNNRF